MLDIFFIIIEAIPSAFHYGISLLANFLTHGFPLLKRDIFRYNKTIAVFVVNRFHDSSTVSECAGDICVCAKRILRGFRWMGVNVVTTFQGSPPHMRGKEDDAKAIAAEAGITPAHAGKR